MSQNSIKKGTLYILWTHPSPGLEKCSATCRSMGICFSARNFGLWRKSKRQTKKNLKHQIISNCPFRYTIEWIIMTMTKNRMISKMINGQSKDMQLQILCEWRQPSGFTRKVPVKDFSDPKKYWYHFYMDVMDVLKIIPKFHSCFFLHYSTKRSTCFINPQDTLTSHHTALLQREGPLLPQYGHVHSNKMMTIQV